LMAATLKTSAEAIEKLEGQRTRLASVKLHRCVVIETLLRWRKVGKQLKSDIRSGEKFIALSHAEYAKGDTIIARTTAEIKHIEASIAAKAQRVADRFSMVRLSVTHLNKMPKEVLWSVQSMVPVQVWTDYLEKKYNLPRILKHMSRNHLIRQYRELLIGRYATKFAEAKLADDIILDKNSRKNMLLAIPLFLVGLKRDYPEVAYKWVRMICILFRDVAKPQIV